MGQPSQFTVSDDRDSHLLRFRVLNEGRRESYLGLIVVCEKITFLFVSLFRHRPEKREETTNIKLEAPSSTFTVNNFRLNVENRHTKTKRYRDQKPAISEQDQHNHLEQRQNNTCHRLDLQHKSIYIDVKP